MANRAGREQGSVVSRERTTMLQTFLSRHWRVFLAKSAISQAIDALRAMAVAWPSHTPPSAQCCTVRINPLTDRIRYRKRPPVAM